jgi:hypothetical protein
MQFGLRSMSEMGPKTEVPGFARHVRFTLRCRHSQPAPACPFGANTGSEKRYSITSSAIRVGGISRPSDFAVLRLMTVRNLEGCSMGSSAGFSPFRILST